MSPIPDYESDWNSTRSQIDKYLKNNTMSDIMAAYKLFQDYHERWKKVALKETGYDWEAEYATKSYSRQLFHGEYYEFFHGEGGQFEEKNPYLRAEQDGHYNEGEHTAYEKAIESDNKALKEKKEHLPGKYEANFKNLFTKMLDHNAQYKKAIMGGLSSSDRTILATEMGKIQKERENEQKAEILRKAAQEAKEKEQKTKETKAQEALENAKKTLEAKDNPAVKSALEYTMRILKTVIEKQQREVNNQGIFSFSSTATQLKANKALLTKLENCYYGRDKSYQEKPIKDKLTQLEALFQERGRSGGFRTNEVMTKCIKEMRTVRKAVITPAETVIKSRRYH